MTPRSNDCDYLSREEHFVICSANKSLTKWSIGIVLTILLAVVPLAWSSYTTTFEKTEQKLKETSEQISDIKTKQEIQATKLQIFADNLSEIKILQKEILSEVKGKR